MNIRITLIFILFTIAIASIAIQNIVYANPVTPRHFNSLNIKQTVFSNPRAGHQIAVVNGVSTPYLMTASMVAPSLHAGRTGVGFMLNQFGATPFSDASLGGGNPIFTVVQRFDYDAFWNSMAALRACESAIEQAYQEFFFSDSENGWSWIFSRVRLFRQEDSGSLANRAMASYPTPYNDIMTPEIMGACPHDPSRYLAAAMTRHHTNNQARDSLQALDYVTSHFWIRRQGATHALRQQVLNYINENNIESAWIDLEFEYTATTMNPRIPNNRRVTMSFIINRGDVLPRPLGCGQLGGVVPSAVAFCGNPVTGTRGQSLGSALVVPPDLNSATIPQTIRDNRILIRYTALQQYPDFFSPNGSISSANITAVNATTPADTNNWGVLSWMITRNTGEISGQEICEIVPNVPPHSVCDNVSGNGRVMLRSGIYDPQFEIEHELVDPSLPPPVLVIRADPLRDESFRCLIRGEGQTCSMDIHNVSSLMQLSNAIEGTLEYTGRWEVDHVNNPPRIREISRDATFNVCHGVGFHNRLGVTYTVRRPRHIIGLTWNDGGFINFTVLSSGYSTENITLPEETVYTTFPTEQNGFNIIGSFNNNEIRANTSTTFEGINLEHEIINSYMITNVPGDPSDLGLNPWEGIMIADPFISYLQVDLENNTSRLYLPTSSRLVYRNIMIPGEDPENRAEISSQITAYAPTGISYSNRLPRNFQNVQSALARSAEFRCADMNENRLDVLATAQRNAPPPSSGFISQQEALNHAQIPEGIHPGSIFAHVTGTRLTYSVAGNPGVANLSTSQPCQVSYLEWRNINAVPTATEYQIPDPNWNAPAICETNPALAICTPPQVSRWSSHLNIISGGPLTYENVRSTCFETCEVGGPVQICDRPHE